jgi:hypothetical protein
MLTGLLLAIFLITAAMLFSKGGLWDNLWAWINTILAGLLATHYFEPLAEWMSLPSSHYHWFWDQLFFWAIYCIAVTMLRMFCEAFSPVRIKFRVPVEMAGKAVFALLTGWTLMCISAFSLHLAATEMTAWGGAFMEKPDDETLFGSDVLWMAFVHKMSDPDSGPISIDEDHQFDAEGLYRVKYGLRRYRYQHLPGGANAGPSPKP